VRVAFSGAHRVGKTTLVEAVAAQLPGHAVFEEPYRLLEEEGWEFGEPPEREDFERQLRRSIELIAAAPADALFDRAPVDFLAYLRGDADVEDVREAMRALDLVVLVSIETPDRVVLPHGEDRRWRRRIDERIGALLVDDPHDFGVRVVEVRGDVDARVAQVLRAVR
jgi:predicted ATPase